MKHIRLCYFIILLAFQPWQCLAQKDSINLENKAFESFSSDILTEKEYLMMLEQFLMYYDDTTSAFYIQGVEEYHTRRGKFNELVRVRRKQDKNLSISSIYAFHYVPEIPWSRSPQQMIKNIIRHYFDSIDFTDLNIAKSVHSIEWMNHYVNLHMQLAKSHAQTDSLATAAAVHAIESAKNGDPVIYGWMVDYFYNGFESNNLPAGMKALTPYLADPRCLTSKRMEIERRLQGTETLKPGIKAPDFTLQMSDGKVFTFYDYQTTASEILLLFWSADCAHCLEEVEKLYPFSQQPAVKDKMDIIAISLDETDTEIIQWQQKITKLKNWKHLRAPEGINSKIANDYFILATPVMILVDASTHQIIALPEGFSELQRISLQQ